MLLAGATICLVLFQLLTLSPSVATAAPKTRDGVPKITQWTLPVGEYEPASIVAGGDGSAWFAINSYVAPDKTPAAYLKNIDRSGNLVSFSVGRFVRDVAHGPDGIWFVRPGHVGRISPDGRVRQFPVGTGFEDSLSIAFGAGGYLWLTKREEAGRVRPAIQRISRDGDVKNFPLPHSNSSPEYITRGDDGAMWFTESFGERIGRITSKGKVTEFSLGVQPFGEIAVGPEGDLWFGTFGGIGRLSPSSGKVKVFGRRRAEGGPVIAGPDGRIWFAMGLNTIGRLTPDGHFSKIHLPGQLKVVNGLAVAPDGSVLYTAKARLTPGAVGRITLNDRS